MQEYQKFLKHILSDGLDKVDRTGVGTKSVFGYQMRFDLQKGFPAVTTKKLAWKAVVSELLWFLEGSNDERRLAEILHGTRDPEKKTIWTANAEAEYWKPKAEFPGHVGNIYGCQWRSWGPRIGEKIDQIQLLVDGLKKDPNSRRHILTAWNPGELDQMCLPPCHILSQFYVANGKLSCQLYQRSVDSLLGLPFNIASYSLLVHILAAECNLDVGEFVWTGGDCHIYNNHLDAVKEQLSRDPLPLPVLKFTPKPLDQYTVDDFVLGGYQHHPPITAPMAV